MNNNKFYNILPLIPVILFFLNTLYSPEIQSTRLLFESFSKGRDGKTDSISIMTFNVRWADLNNKEDNGPYSWPARKQKVFDIINYYKPLIVGTQEALILQHNDMMASLRSDYSSIGFCKVTILYKKSELEVLSQGEFWLEDPTKLSENIRRASWGIFRFKKQSSFSFGTNVEFLVINTHNSPRSESKRRDQSRTLLEKALELSKNGTILTFLVGDFNSNPAHFSHKFLVESPNGNFSDSWNICSDLGPSKCLQNNVPSTYHHFLGVQVFSFLARLTIQYPLFLLHGQYPPSFDRFHLDWILYQSPNKSGYFMEPTLSAVIVEPSDTNENTASDHFPVFSAFKIHKL